SLQRIKRLQSLTIGTGCLDNHVREACLHRLEKSPVCADAIGECVESRTVNSGNGSDLAGAFAAPAARSSASAFRLHLHLPPPTWISNRPRSGKLASLSSWAISVDRKGRTPLAIS